MIAQLMSLIGGLNDNLSREFQAIIRYTQCAAGVHGPFRLRIVEMGSREITDVLSHESFVLDEIRRVAEMRKILLGWR